VGPVKVLIGMVTLRLGAGLEPPPVGTARVVFVGRDEVAVGCVVL